MTKDTDQTTEGDVILPAEPNALQMSIDEVDSFITSGDSLQDVENDVSLTESVFLILSQLRYLQSTTIPASSIRDEALEKVERIAVAEAIQVHQIISDYGGPKDDKEAFIRYDRFMAAIRALKSQEAGQ